MSSTYPPRSRQKESGLTTFELERLPSLPSSFVDSKAGGSAAAAGDIELKPLPSTTNNSQTILRPTTTRSSLTNPRTPQDEAEDPIPPELLKKYKRNDRIQFAALCWLVFLVGWNDGTTGPLIPRMQVDYRLDYLIVSLLFVATAIGHIVGAAANVWLNDHFGFGKTLVLGACVQTMGYVIMCPTPPFPAFAFASGLTGFGISLANGQANGFLGSLKKNMHTKLGIYHGCYGLGAFLAPFVSTVFLTQPRWTFHYLTSAGMQLTNIAALILVFKFRRQEEILADAGQFPSDTDPNTAALNDNKFKSMLKQPAVHLLAAFCLIYVGIEVSLGGWIVTFIIRERSGGPSSGYISSGFFGGLALGRVALIGVNKWIGEERVVYIYTVLAIILELTIWFVPSIIQNAIAVSIIGLLLGPFFPIIVSHSSRILPHWMLTACVGWIAGIGVSGSAVLPFITGVLASRFGIRSLQPLMVSMMGGMVLMWLCVPKVNRRID